MDGQRNQRSRGRAAKALEARYANYFEVGHNACEFVFDFGQYHPEDSRARMHTRMITGPVYAKLLGGLLRVAIERFEREFGVIPDADDDMDPLEMVKQSIAGFERRADTAARSRQ